MHLGCLLDRKKPLWMKAYQIVPCMFQNVFGPAMRFELSTLLQAIV